MITVKDWINHEQGQQPKETFGKQVQVKFGNDDHITKSISAEDVNWDFPRDPVVAYRIVE